jgi:enoyl-CoA hydratase/carnithine racemase
VSDDLGAAGLRLEREGVIAWCVIDRPEARNAFTPAMYFGLKRAVHLVNTDPDLAALIITGTGDVFAPGGDLGGRTEDHEEPVPDALGHEMLPFLTIRDSPAPVIAAVNGICQAGGLLIAMLADVAVASDRATFRAPELLRGIGDTNYAQVLPRQIGPARARDMLLTGRVVSAAEAEAWGLVARVVPHEQLLDEAGAALEACCRTAPSARFDVKRTLHEYYGHYDRMAMDASISGDEMVEGFRAFKERRSPSWVPEELRTEGRL